MKINLTKEQYEDLVKIVYLGNWVATSCVVEKDKNQNIKNYDEITDYVFSFSSEFGLPKNMEYELDGFDKEEETEVRFLIDEYDDETFWQELPDRLGKRDFLRKYTDIERSRMDREEHFIKLQECIIKWEQEFEENGVENLGLMKLGLDI